MTEPRPLLSTPCWLCLQLERPLDGAMRLSLCSLHLQREIRRLMGLPEIAA